MPAARSAVTQEHVAEEHTEQGNLPTTDLYQCSVCNRTYHWSCLKQLQCYKEEDIDAQSDWSCPACHDLSLIFFWGDVTATAPSRDLTDNKKKRGGRAQAEEKARGSCSRRPRTRERKPGKRKGSK